MKVLKGMIVMLGIAVGTLMVLSPSNARLAPPRLCETSSAMESPIPGRFICSPNVTNFDQALVRIGLSRDSKTLEMGHFRFGCNNPRIVAEVAERIYAARNYGLRDNVAEGRPLRVFAHFDAKMGQQGHTGKLEIEWYFYRSAGLMIFPLSNSIPVTVLFNIPEGTACSLSKIDS